VISARPAPARTLRAGAGSTPRERGPRPEQAPGRRPRSQHLRRAAEDPSAPLLRVCTARFAAVDGSSICPFTAGSNDARNLAPVTSSRRRAQPAEPIAFPLAGSTRPRAPPATRRAPRGGPAPCATAERPRLLGWRGRAELLLRHEDAAPAAPVRSRSTPSAPPAPARPGPATSGRRRAPLAPDARPGRAAPVSWAYPGSLPRLPLSSPARRGRRRRESVPRAPLTGLVDSGAPRATGPDRGSIGACSRKTSAAHVRGDKRADVEKKSCGWPSARSTAERGGEGRSPTRTSTHHQDACKGTRRPRRRGRPGAPAVLEEELAVLSCS
jgi:hypothetical protein